jgi:short-subunit dehydrogenase
MKLDGTHALVTGASHGIGIDIARQLTAKGSRVTVTGRDKERTIGVAERLGARAVVADLADEAQLATVIADAEAANGPLDLLINNAAVALVASVRDSEPGQAAELMTVNAVAPMELCRQALPGMLARGRGYLVNVSSLAGVSAVPDMPVYGASKAALHHYTSVLSRELARTPVTAMLATFGEVSGTYMMEEARRSPVISQVSRRLARALPTMTTDSVARQLVEAVERDATVVTIPRRLGAVIALRNLPSTLQDLAFIGIKR